MHIIYLASELLSVAKVGGLGDVTFGLSHALVQKGNLVEVILPFYDHIDRNRLQNLKIDCDNLISHENKGNHKNRVWSAQINEIPILLIESQNDYFKRGVIYGEEDDDLRFVCFTYIAMEYLLHTHKNPKILHLHDWHTALAAPLYYGKYKALGLNIGRIVMTMHNTKYQGVCDPKLLSQIEFDLKSPPLQDGLQDCKKSNKINLLKGGVLYSDALTTVSPSYAEEIKGKEGYGLEQLFRKKKDFIGILNGIDTQYWNPKTDPLLKRNYPIQPISFNKIYAAKRANRIALNNILKTNYDLATPLFACITRLVHQKAPELIHFGLEHIIKQGGQCILLASTPQQKVKKLFSFLADKYRGNPHLFCHFVFDERLAHLAFASSDCILIPSLFEPCGLTQMIAMRYGTIPIVHKVGGLKDTVFDIDHSEYPLNQRNGYTFDSPSNKDLQRAIDRAFEHYYNDQKKWRSMLTNGLSRDWSWEFPSMKYLELYRKISQHNTLSRQRLDK